MNTDGLKETVGRNRFRRALPFFCGIPAALPVIFPAIGVLEWILFVPFALLCAALQKEKFYSTRDFRHFYAVGFRFFMGFFLTAYSWLWSMYPLSVTGLPRPAAFGTVLFSWIGIPLFQSVGFAFALPLYVYLSACSLARRHNYLMPFVMGAIWSVGEWVQNFGWFGVPWARLAIGQTAIPEMIQSASLFGSYFVTFLIISVNFLLAEFFRSIKCKDTCTNATKSGVLCAFLAVLLTAANFCYGFVVIKKYDVAKASGTVKTVKIAAIQGNVSTDDKWNSKKTNESFSSYGTLTEKAAEDGADYVLWPETVIPYVVQNYPGLDGKLWNIAQENGICLFAGTFTESDAGISNSIRVYDAGGVCENVYSKQRVVPFGEYIPMRGILTAVLPFLNDINILDRSLAPGTESSVWQDSEGNTFSFLICFDSIYASLARQSVLDGAQVLLISTNDSWFGSSVGTVMHNAQSVLRAVENRRYVVRAANTGISSAIDKCGRSEKRITVGEKDYFVTDTELCENFTLYTLIGDSFVCLCLAVLVFCLVAGLVGRRKMRKRES